MGGFSLTMVFNKKGNILIIIAAFILFVVSLAHAKYNPKITVEKTTAGTAYVTINQTKVIHLKVNNGSLLPADRANIVAERLKSFADKNYNPNLFSVKSTQTDSRLFFDDKLLLIVTKADAKSNKTTASALASSWITNLKKALSLPPLSVSRNDVLIPLGETRKITVISLLTDPVTASISDPAVVSTNLNKNTLVMTGKALGSSRITLSSEGHEVSINVSVKKYAAYPKSEKQKSIVTGKIAPSSLVNRAIKDAARRSVNIESGALIKNIHIVSPASDLASGLTAEKKVSIKVCGASYIPATLDLNVIIENKPIHQKKSESIMYSNNPEQIKKYQTLFTGRFDTVNESYRLLYHHQNMMGSATGFVIEIINSSDKPASLHFVEGISEPMLDTVIVGYVAGLEFMNNHKNMIGRVINIEPGSRWVLLSQSIPATNTASGIIEFRQIAGDPLFLRVIAKPEQLRIAEDTPGIALPTQGLTADSFQLSDHVYPQPEKTIEAEYVANKPWVFLRIGKNAIKHAEQEDKVLYGNYGVTYNINAKLINPTDKNHKVEIVYEATAGPLSGIFYLDGQLNKIRMLRPPKDATIATITIPAGQTKNIQIKTMPLSGSAYPSTLVIRPAGTLSSVANK